MKTTVVIILLLLLIIFYNYCKNVEPLVNVDGYVTKESIQANINQQINSIAQNKSENIVTSVSKSIVPEVKSVTSEMQKTNTLSISNILSATKSQSIQEIPKAETSILNPNEVLWENRPTSINEIINSIKADFQACGIKTLDVKKEDVALADSRIKFIQFLPVTNLLNSLTYESIRCFVQKIDKTNLVSWIKEETNIPKYLLPKNMIIVNDNLYQSSPYGVLKYKLPLLNKYIGNTTLNATMEASLLNDYNFFNRGSDIIFPFQGAIIQKINSQYFDLKSGDKYEIRKLVDRVDLLNSRVLKDISPIELESKFEIKSEKQIADSLKNVIKNEVTTEVKQEVLKQINNDDEVKNALVKISQSNSLPDVKNEVNKVLAKLVAEKVNVSEVKAEIKSDLKKEGFAAVGFVDKVPVTAETKIIISQEVIKDILVTQNDVKSIKSNVGEVNEEKLNNDVVYVAEYSGINYLFSKDEVKPYSKWAQELNKTISESRLTIKTVIPHYFIQDGKFSTKLIVVLSDDFYVVVNGNSIEKPRDFKKDFNFSFSDNLMEVYTCNENKVILEQMTRANIITEEKRQEMLAKLKCN